MSGAEVVWNNPSKGLCLTTHWELHVGEGHYHVPNKHFLVFR